MSRPTTASLVESAPGVLLANSQFTFQRSGVRSLSPTQKRLPLLRVSPRAISRIAWVNSNGLIEEGYVMPTSEPGLYKTTLKGDLLVEATVPPPTPRRKRGP
jgi:hypothetical protein